MKFYDPYNLPKPLFEALAKDEYSSTGDYSTTTLLNPPRIYFLTKRHIDEISVNIMSRYFSMRGTALHKTIEGIEVPGAIIEKRFEIEVANKIISMQPDYVYPYEIIDGTTHYCLMDHKEVFVSNIKYGIKEDHKKQLNIYAYGLRKKGIYVDKLILNQFIRDWSYTDSKFKKDYPAVPLLPVEVELMSDNDILQYLETRIELFENVKNLQDKELPKCTAEERWAKPDSYAVVYDDSCKSPGRAVKGGAWFEEKALADQFLLKREATGKTNAIVQYRRSESIRCEREYCDCKNFCDFYKTVINPNPF